MLRASYQPYTLVFKAPATTSRAVMTTKPTWFIKVWDDEAPDVIGIGECALFPGLSADDTPYYEKILARACETINEIDVRILQKFSSIRFGIETALRDLEHGGQRVIYDTPFVRGDERLVINGLVWMGTADEMLARIDEKISAGFRCIKLKIGGIDFDRELDLLKHIRDAFPASELTLRLDANGAFTTENALERLDRLARFDIHSIEQPIRQGQWVEMATLTTLSPIPIALDEELIGIDTLPRKRSLIEVIRPKYLILKPALCGGLTGSYEWVQLAGEYGLGWWLTSALESNIGLNAIAQFASSLERGGALAPRPAIPQGLGTGALYVNNIPSPLCQESDYLCYNPSKSWDLSPLK